jgi:hypothetical protein
MKCVMKFGRHLPLASLDYHVQSLMLKMWCSSHWELVSCIMHSSIPVPQDADVVRIVKDAGRWGDWCLSILYDASSRRSAAIGLISGRIPSLDLIASNLPRKQPKS